MIKFKYELIPYQYPKCDTEEYKKEMYKCMKCNKKLESYDNIEVCLKDKTLKLWDLTIEYTDEFIKLFDSFITMEKLEKEIFENMRLDTRYLEDSDELIKCLVSHFTKEGLFHIFFCEGCIKSLDSNKLFIYKPKEILGNFYLEESFSNNSKGICIECNKEYENNNIIYNKNPFDYSELRRKSGTFQEHYLSVFDDLFKKYYTVKVILSNVYECFEGYVTYELDLSHKKHKPFYKNVNEIFMCKKCFDSIPKEICETHDHID